MTDEQFLRDALRVEAEREPLPADAWARVASAVHENERRRFRRRVAQGAGAAVMAAAAAIGVGLVVMGDEGALVLTDTGTSVPTIPTIPTSPPVTTATTAPGTTISSGTTAGSGTTVGSDTTIGSDTTVGADTTAGVDTTVESGTTPLTATGSNVRPLDPVLAVRADGRVVTLSAEDGSEIVQLGAVQPTDGATGIGVSQANGVGYYSGPYEDTGRIWKVPVAGGAPQQIAFGSYPAVSPDGATLAFVRPPNTIVLLDTGTNQEISATTWDPNDPDFFHLGGRISRLEWSPDGTAIAFQTDYEGSEILVFRPSEHATLSDAIPTGGAVSPTWKGADQVESVMACCYPEFSEPRDVRMYAVGTNEPLSTDPRQLVAVDRRPAGDRLADINLDDPDVPVAGTLTLRNAAGDVVWQTTDRFMAVSV